MSILRHMLLYHYLRNIWGLMGILLHNVLILDLTRYVEGRHQHLRIIGFSFMLPFHLGKLLRIYEKELRRYLMGLMDILVHIFW